MSLTVPFDKAIILAGYGKFHYELVAVCALCFLAVGFQNGMSAYVLPVAQCDLDLSSAEMGFLNVSFLLGGISSALLWGLMADIIGRKKVLVWTIFTDWAITLTSSLSTTYETLAIFRFLDGFFIGAPGTIIFLYLAEFHPEHKKSRSVCYVGFFFTLSWVLLPVFAWLIIPLKFEWEFLGVELKTWRWFILVLSLNLLIGGFFLMFFPESPKFLLARGERKKALQILKKMYAKNFNKNPEDFPVKILQDELKIKDDPKDSVGPVGSGRIVRLIKDMTEQIKALFRKPLIFLTILSSLLLFTNMYGFYGLGLWIPEIFSRFEEFSLLFPEKRMTFCQIQDEFFASNYSHPKIETLSDQSEHCNNDLDTTVFINTIIMGICCCIGNLMSAILAGRYDRRLLPVSTMLTGGLAACVMYWLNSGNQHLVASCVFQAAMSTGNMAMNGVVVDIFPADVSAMAVCTATLAGRLGAVVSNLSFGLLLDQSCEVPIFVVGVILAIGGFLGMFLPPGKTKKIDMSDDINKIEKVNQDKISSIEKIPEISIISVD